MPFHSPMLFCLRKFHLCYTVIWLLVNLWACMKCHVFLIQPPQTDLALSAFHTYYHHCIYTVITLLHPYLPQCNLSQELLRDKHFFFSHSSLSLITVFILKFILSDISIVTDFLSISMCMEYLLPSPHFQTVWVSWFEVSLL